MIVYTHHFIKLFFRVALFAVALMGISYLPQITLAQQTENDTTKAAEILAQVNAWRISNGLWPLTINPTLEALALAQANYVLPFLSNIQNEEQYHLDSKLRNPRQRGAAAGWPSYGTTADRIEIGENAGVGTAKFVMNFWRSSPIHAKAALSTTYREVGVAALRTKSGGTFYLMDFGARPGVLPVVVNNDGTSLWLTDEKSRYAKVTTATKVRLLDAAGKPLTDILAWSPSLRVPDDSPDLIQVVYINGDTQITTAISRGGQSIALAPTATATSRVSLAPTATLLVTAAPTTTSAVVAVNPTLIPSTRAPDATPTIPAVPTVDPATADILLTYNASALFLRNNSKTPIDISGLSLLGSGVTVGAPLWGKVGDFPAAAFPPSHCVAITLINTAYEIPSTCKWTRSIINLLPAKIFWTLDNFIVSVNGTTLANCKPNDGLCAIDLP